MSQSGSILASGGGGGGASSFPADTGTATQLAGVLNIFGGATAPETTVNINTAGSGNTISIALNNTIFWPGTDSTGTTGVIYFDTETFLHSWDGLGGASNSVFLGRGAGSLSVLNNPNSIGVGALSLSNSSSGENVAVGVGALNGVTGGGGNVAIGHQSMQNGTSTMDGNVAVGFQSLINLQSGDSNVAIGDSAGTGWTTTENNNVAISHAGVLGDSGVMRLGTSGDQTSCFIAGIYTASIGATNHAVFIDNDGKLGVGIATLPYTNVNTTPYVVLATDEYLGVDSSGGAITVQLPNAPVVGRVFIIKDRTGSAATNAITVTTVGGAVNIDGATTFVMNTAFESVQVLFDGTTYQIF